MKHLFKCWDDHKYVQKGKSKCESTTIHDIFWAHHVYVKLFNIFPSVLIMNYTYKASVYRKPSSEIVGINSKEKT